MNETMLPFRDVRKPSLVLVKGGRGHAAAPSLTDDERYPRFPPAWVDWLVLGLGLAALNLPTPVPLFSVGSIVLIAVLVARRITKAGGEDPNIDDGVATFFAEFFTHARVKRPLERQLPPVTAFTKQVIIFSVCECLLYFLHRNFPLSSRAETSDFLTLGPFLSVVLFGLLTLWWWDAPSAPKTHTPKLNTPKGSRRR